MTDYSYIGKKIRELRKLRGITQKELANKIDKAESSIQKYEAGKVVIPMDVLMKISEELDISYLELLWFDPNEIERVQQQQEEFSYFDKKLEQIGYRLDQYYGDDMQSIVYPDGILYITDIELKELDESTNSFLKFKLEELKQKKLNDFRKFDIELHEMMKNERGNKK